MKTLEHAFEAYKWAVKPRITDEQGETIFTNWDCLLQDLHDAAADEHWRTIMRNQVSCADNNLWPALSRLALMAMPFELGGKINPRETALLDCEAGNEALNAYYVAITGEKPLLRDWHHAKTLATVRRENPELAADVKTMHRAMLAGAL